MRFVLPNFITAKQAEELVRTKNTEKVGKKIIKTIAKLFGETPEKLTNRHTTIRIEAKARGHDWHFDGCKPKICGKEGAWSKIPEGKLAKTEDVFNEELVNNHMAWCKYGASLLLTDPSTYQGGEFEYLNTDGTVKTLQKEHYLALAVHTAGADNSPELHRVLPHKPNPNQRHVILVFLGYE